MKATPHQSRSRILLGIIAASLAASAAIWITFKSETGAGKAARNDTQNHGSPAATSTVRAADAGPSFNWVKGTHAAYDYRLEASSRIEAIAGGSPQESSPSYLAAGKMHLRLIDVTPKGPLIAFLFQDAQILKAGTRMRSLEQLACNVPCVVQMDPRGRILSASFSSRLGQEDKTSLAGLYSTQIVLPENGGRRQWETVEEDLYGAWKCNYSLPENEFGIIRKSRKASSPKDGAIAIEARQSDIQCSLGPVWLQELKLEECLAFLHEGQVLSLVTVKLTIKQVAEPSPMPTALAALNPADYGKGVEMAALRGSPQGSEGSSAFSKDEQTRMREKYGGITCAQFVQKLSGIVASAKSHADTVQATHELSDMIRAYPERAAELAALIPGVASNSELTARMIHALELAGSLPEAQEALARILASGDQAPKSVLEQAAVAAGGVGEIKSRNLVEALFHTAQHQDLDISDAASFAVGALAAANVPLQQTVLDSYTPALAPANADSDDARVALRVLQNSGLSSPGILADSARIAREGSTPGLRAAAVDYLGNVNPEHPENIIPALGDPEESVRIAAAYALTATSKTRAEGVNAVAQLLRNQEISPSLRSALVDSLAPHVQAFPEARRALQVVQSAAGTPPELRERIFSTLSDPAKPVFFDQLQK